jgi:hypothetical protein
MTPVVDGGEPRLHSGIKETLFITFLKFFIAYLLENYLNFEQNLKNWYK